MSLLSELLMEILWKSVSVFNIEYRMVISRAPLARKDVSTNRNGPVARELYRFHCFKSIRLPPS